MRQNVARPRPVSVRNETAERAAIHVPLRFTLFAAVRACGALAFILGLEVLFTPFYAAKRNHQIETFHSIWNQAFWSRQEFRNCAHVQAEAPVFEHWYHTFYRPPALQGKTPAQIRRGMPVMPLTAELQRLIPKGRLPITAGQIPFMRKVETTADVNLLNETWAVGLKWIGEHVCATVNTAEEALTFWHKQDAERDWQLLKTRQFRLNETVQPLLPAFRRNPARCREYLPD